MRWIDLELERNEASDLLALESAGVLEAHGWDRAYYIVLDEGHLDDAVAVLGHRAGCALADGWDDHLLPADCGEHAGKTDDAEAAARFEGFVYVVGSHYGSKAGPLKAKRQWVARFAEDQLAGDLAETRLEAQVWRDDFRLHRAINDALAASGLDVIAPDDRMTAAFITPTREKAERKKKARAERLRHGDHPLNIEAAAFRPDGALVLGLRFPVCADGAPLLVELTGVPERFGGGPDPRVVAVRRLDGPGRPDEPVGFRAMVAGGDDGFDCIVGSLDAPDKGSLLLECLPAGAHAVSQHWRFELGGHGDGAAVPAQRAAMFEDLQRIEGLAHGPDGHFVYVVDEDHRVHMRFLAVD